MDLGLLLRIIFYIAFYGVGMWMFIVHMQYHQKARKMNHRTDTSFGDLLYGSRVTSEENNKFYKDLFSRNIENLQLRKAIWNIRLSYAIVLIVIFIGIIIFNIS